MKGDHIKDRPWAVDHMGEPATLAGWDERDEEHPLPLMERDHTEQELELIKKANQATRFPPVKEPTVQVMESVLYYAPGEQEKIDRRRAHGRQYKQMSRAVELLSTGTRLVLLTPDFRVIQGLSFKKVVWLYFREWVKKLFSRPKKPLKIPTYY